jgi:hypothetical protein
MKTSHEEFFLKNSELSIEFSKYVLEHSEMEDLLSEDKVIIFLPEFDPELREFNMRMASDLEAEGGKVVYIKVKHLSPKVTSRLVGVEVAAH